MIKTFKHKGLKDFFHKGSLKGIQPVHAEKLTLILATINIAKNTNALNIPAFRFHPLKGELNNYYSMTVNGNWRIIFKFENENAYIIDYVDYH